MKLINSQQSLLDRAIARHKRQQVEAANVAMKQSSSIPVAPATPASAKAHAPSLTQAEIDYYVGIIREAAAGFDPNESTTDRLIRERLKAQGIKPVNVA